jgi:hypothetical protein
MPVTRCLILVAGCSLLVAGDWMPDQVRHDVRTSDSQVIKKGIKKIIL